MLPQTQRTTQPRIPPTSSLKSSFLTIQVKSKRVTLQFSIATPLTSPANSMKSNQRSTEDLVRSSKKSQSTSSLVMPLSSEWYHKSQCALKLSNNTHHSEDSPLETWNKPLPSVLSRKSSRRNKRVPSPRPPKRRSEQSLLPLQQTSKNLLHKLNLLRNFKIKHIFFH